MKESDCKPEGRDDERNTELHVEEGDDVGSMWLLRRWRGYPRSTIRVQKSVGR